MAAAILSDEEISRNLYKPWYQLWATKPHFIDQRHERHDHPMLEGNFLSPVLFTLEQSEARDYCANERTFLSWLRLSVYMALFAVAIVANFHLRTKPTPEEKRVSLPLGIVFWLLSGACLVNGIITYMRTAERYGRRIAIVQSGWKTQVMLAVLATAIVATCCYFIGVNAARAA